VGVMASLAIIIVGCFVLFLIIRAMIRRGGANLPIDARSNDYRTVLFTKHYTAWDPQTGSKTLHFTYPDGSRYLPGRIPLNYDVVSDIEGVTVAQIEGPIVNRTYPAQPPMPVQPSWAPALAAGAIGFIAGEMVERHHHHKVEARAQAHAQFQADMDRIIHPQPVHHQPQPVWDAAGADHRPYWGDAPNQAPFDPYNSDGGHHFGHHSW
jgi:hypothetical protein